MLWATRHNTYLELRKWPSDGHYMDGCGGPHGGWWSKPLYIFMWFEIQICRSFLVTHCWGPDNRTPWALLTQTSTSSHALGICVIKNVVIFQDATSCCLAVYSTFKRRPYLFIIVLASVCDDRNVSDAQKHMCHDAMRSYKEICVLCSPSGFISCVRPCRKSFSVILSRCTDAYAGRCSTFLRPT